MMYYGEQILDNSLVSQCPEAMLAKDCPTDHLLAGRLG